MNNTTKYEKIYFTIQCEELETDFYNEYNEEGECTDSGARNPCSTWTNYNNWDNGWTEQDPGLNEIWAAIKEYSTSLELFEFVSSFTPDDVGINYENTYYCDSSVEENKEHTFIVTCYDIEKYEIEE